MFKFPYTNLHELNLDWILEKVKTLVANNDEFNEKADYAVETADEAKTIAEQAAQAQIGDGAVTTSKLADGAVTSAKLANNAVYSANIMDGEVGTSDLAEGAVTTSRILDGAVTGAKIFDGAVTNDKLGNGAVTNGKIADGAITTAKLASGSVTANKIESNFLRIQTVQSAEPITINAGDVATFTIDATLAGYTPLGIIGVTKSGGGSGYITISSFYFNAPDTTAKIAVYNNYSSSLTVYGIANVLYVKSA